MTAIYQQLNISNPNNSKQPIQLIKMTSEQVISIINKRLAEKKISKRRLCLDLDIPNSSIYDMFSWKMDFPLKKLLRILEYLDLEIDIK